MFTGIISAIGHVRTVTPLGDGLDMRLIIGAAGAFLAAQGGTALGASIACSGCCLTVTDLGPDWFAVEVSAETLAHTAIGGWEPGTAVNLERSLRFGDELGGHMVSGHVDGLGRIVSMTPENGSLRIAIAVPAPLHRFIAPKGSVAVDGISLTVNETALLPGGVQAFGVNIIPHTAAHTTLGLRQPGDAVQIEIDMLARYVARLTETA
jgi:riboflavin synthase